MLKIYLIVKYFTKEFVKKGQLSLIRKVTFSPAYNKYLL